ncbi:MFS transporter OS=Streptomyces microflavus OX=1919 GN=Smic_01490 PE=4 SV=1 [Streptomyces microflavus]
MLVSGFLLESFSPFQVVASLHGLAIAGCLALLAYLVLRRPSTEPDARVRPPGGGVLRKERG